MKITLHTWDSYEVDLPETSHTYEEILSELKKKSDDAYMYLLRLVKEWPQTKQVVPFFYDYIFATNYKDAEKWFIKSLLNFPSTYEAEQVLFSLFDVTWSFWIPVLIWKEYLEWNWIIEPVCTLIWDIIEFGTWYNNIWLMSWKQIRVILLDCEKSIPIETWQKKIPEVEYFSNKISKLYEKYPELWDRVLYDKISELENF